MAHLERDRPGGLRDLKRRGLPAPMLAIADGALGFWAALREVYPDTQEQLCCVHKIANVLDKLPKRLQSRAKEMLHEIMRSPSRKDLKDAGCRLPQGRPCAGIQTT